MEDEQKKVHKIKKWKVFVIILFVIFLSIIFAGYIFIKSKINKVTYKPLDEVDLGIDTSVVETKTNIEEKTKFVIFGSDSRDTENEYAGRSDTIIIVVIDNVEKNINLISIPRDTYVDVPGYGMTKINHAFSYGQEQLSLKTINSNFGLDLKQYITIDFSGMVDSINRVGGIEIALDQDEVNFINARVGIEDRLPGAGEYTINGTQALVHSRNRYVGNDFTRASRQRAILESLIRKASRMSEKDVLSVLDDILENLTTNMDMNSYKEMFLEVFDSRKEYSSNIKSLQIPSTDYGYDYMLNGIYYFAFDIDRAIQDFNTYYYGE